MNLNMAPKKVVRILTYFFIFTLLFGTLAFAKGGRGGSVSVKGYYRANGTYVQPHHRSAPDGNFYNNWSTKGNVNPYTGKEGTRITPPDSYKGSDDRAVPLNPSITEPNSNLYDGDQRN